MNLTTCLVLAAIAFQAPRMAPAGTLYFTLPDRGQDRWIELDPETGDSVHQFSCQGTTTIQDLRWLYLLDASKRVTRTWRDQVVDSFDVSGMKGQADSITGLPPGNYAIIVSNDGGLSCPSNLATIAPSDPTGVPEGPGGDPDPVIACALFDVRGRRVASFPGSVWLKRSLGRGELAGGVLSGRLGSGIYWLRGTTRKGRRLIRRTVILEGSEIGRGSDPR